MENYLIQEAEDSDWSEIKKICAQTGQAGDPVESDRSELYSEIWVGPYEAISDNYSVGLVCKNEDSVQGYLIGATDSKAFRTWKSILFDVPLFFKILFRRYPNNSDAQRFKRRLFKKEKSPEDSFAAEDLKEVLVSYPAHLHMNFLPQARGQGWGQKIFQRFIEILKEQKVSGVHLFCGAEARSFYLKCGFAEFRRIEFRPGVHVFLMTYKI